MTISYILLVNPQLGMAMVYSVNFYLFQGGFNLLLSEIYYHYGGYFQETCKSRSFASNLCEKQVLETFCSLSVAPLFLVNIFLTHIINQ